MDEGLQAGLLRAAAAAAATATQRPTSWVLPGCAAGGYVVRDAKLPEYVVPDLSGFQVG